MELPTGYRPKTGRSHQIRVHLGHVGYPIANDWLYGGRLAGKASSLATGRARNLTGGRPQPPLLPPDKDACTAQSSASSPHSGLPAPGGCSANVLHVSPVDANRGGSTVSGCEPSHSLVASDDQAARSASGDTTALLKHMRFLHTHSDRHAQEVSVVQVDELHFDALCRHCPSVIPAGWPTDLNPLWLHARSYSGPGFAFSSPLPAWASQIDDSSC